jgi:hypothetical protein
MVPWYLAATVVQCTVFEGLLGHTIGDTQIVLEQNINMSNPRYRISVRAAKSGLFDPYCSLAA